MNKDFNEMVTWLLLEQRATKNQLNAQGCWALTELRQRWNIEKADKVFKEYLKGENNEYKL